MSQRLNRQEKTGWEVYLLGIFIILLPFVVYFHQELLTSEGQRVFAAENGMVTDFFLYYKEWMVLAVAGVLAFSFLADLVTGNRKKPAGILQTKGAKMVFLFAGISGLFIILSAIRACMEGRADTVWMGIYTEGEGVFTLLAYLVLFLAGYLYFRSDAARRVLRYCLVILMTLLAILAIVDALTGGIYTLPFMKYLIAPKEYRNIAANLKNTMSDKVSLGCYNPGYFGGLCAMLFPIAAGIAYQAEKMWKKLAGAFLSAGLLLAEFLAGSTGPLYAVIVGIVLLAFVFRRDVKNACITFGCIAVCLIAGLLAGNIMTGGRLSNRVKEVIVHPDTVGHAEEQFKVSEMQIKDGILSVKGEEHAFLLDAPKGENSTLETLTICDEQGQEIVSRMDGEKRFLTQKGYEGVILSNEDGMLLLDLGYEDGIWFYVTDQGIRLAGQNGAKLDDIPQPAVTGMENLYHLATGRGYTWVQSLPILKKCLLLGKGAGNFVYLFRQNEVAGLLNTHGSSQYVIDKPHNWYLQMMINNGGIAMILFVILLVILAKCGIGKYILSKELVKEDIVDASVLIGVGVFAIAGLVNDSIVAVSPIFWLLCGTCCEALDQ